MNSISAYILSESILIPIVVGIIYFKKISSSYYPFLLLLLIGGLNELLSAILINVLGLRNAVSGKIYSLIECCLILYQLYVWRDSKKLYVTYLLIIGICVLVWITENVFLLKSNEQGPYFMMVYAFFIVLLSINQINIIMVRPEAPLLKNPVIVFCIAFIIFFIYQIVYDAAMYQSQETKAYSGVFAGIAYINVATNILYAIALYLVKKTLVPVHRKPFYNR